MLAIERQFQDVQSQMEDLKSEIEKHRRIYEISVNNRRSILDERDSSVASKRILELSQHLYDLAMASLNNKEVIRQVSNSENTFRDYQKYAEKMLNRFEDSK